jgi:hypothetical protein
LIIISSGCSERRRIRQAEELAIRGLAPKSIVLKDLVCLVGEALT